MRQVVANYRKVAWALLYLVKHDLCQQSVVEEGVTSWEVVTYDDRRKDSRLVKLLAHEGSVFAVDLFDKPLPGNVDFDLLGYVVLVGAGVAGSVLKRTSGLQKNAIVISWNTSNFDDWGGIQKSGIIHSF